MRNAWYRSFSSDACDAEEYMRKVRHTLPPTAQRMLDEGVLEKCHPGVRSPSGRDVLKSYLTRCRDAEERQEAVVCFTLLLNRYRLTSFCCENCLYPKERCICDFVTKVVPRHKLWLFQHVGEYGRNNNTGSLLCLVAGAERTVRGIRAQQEKMLDHIDRNRYSTVILFPNSNSITLDEYREERVVSMGSKEEEEEEPLTLLLLDGTSRQAKNFDRFMPADIPRVRIRETSVHSWLDPIRRQTEEHRVCTAQGLFLISRYCLTMAFVGVFSDRFFNSSLYVSLCLFFLSFSLSVCFLNVRHVSAAAMILHELGDRRASQAIEGAVRSMLKIAAMKRYITPPGPRREKRHSSKLFSSRVHAT